MTFKHNLGDKSRDRISGLTGIIVSRAEHLFGCARYWIQPQDTKDGKPQEGSWFDEESIEVLESAVVTPKQYRVVDVEAPPLRRAGGPGAQPASHTDSRGR